MHGAQRFESVKFLKGLLFPVLEILMIFKKHSVLRGIFGGPCYCLIATSCHKQGFLATVDAALKQSRYILVSVFYMR